MDCSILCGIILIGVKSWAWLANWGSWNCQYDFLIYGKWEGRGQARDQTCIVLVTADGTLQSATAASQVRLCVLFPLTVALSAMSHLCSVCWLKTHCLCSPLHFCRLLYSLRLFVFSFPPAHSFVLVWVSLCCSSSASLLLLLLLQLISLLNWGNLLDKTDKTPFFIVL